MYRAVFPRYKWFTNNRRNKVTDRILWKRLLYFYRDATLINLQHFNDHIVIIKSIYHRTVKIPFCIV